MTPKDMEAKIGGAIKTYSKYRSPEVIAELRKIQYNEERLLVSFKGTFYRTCGFCDYFEDLVYEILDKAETHTRVLDIKEEWDSEIFTVTYLIEK